MKASKYHFICITMLVMMLLSCTKEPAPYQGVSPDPGSFAHFTKPAGEMMTYTTAKDGLTLTVSGVTLSTSHTDDIVLKATITDDKGAVTDVTKKTAWSVPGLDPVEVWEGNVRSKYKDVHDLPYAKYEPGELPEVTSYVKAVCVAGGQSLSVTVPVIFRRTVWIGVSAGYRLNRENGNQYEFRPVASRPVPFTVNITASAGHAGTLSWQIDEGSDTDGYLRVPDRPVNDLREAQEARVLFLSFNDWDQSRRLYVEQEKTTYLLTAEAFPARKDLSYGKD